MSRWVKVICAGLAVSVVLAGALAAQTRFLAPADKALLIVRVPTDDATVRIADYTTLQRGTERLFSTPALAAGQWFSYPIEVTWTEAGQSKKAMRHAYFKAGESTVIDFTIPADAERVGKPIAKKTDEKSPGKSRQFLFTYAGALKGLPPGKEARVWLPVAVSGPEQEAKIITQNLPTDGKIYTEKQYGNTSLYFKAKANDQGEIPFEIIYKVMRKEVKTDVAANLVLKPAPKENLTRFLEPDARVPIVGKPLELLKDRNVPSDQFAAAKVFYDVVNNHMKYSKEGKGWGNGDSVWACDSKFGNCSDFHSLFISMARGNKIPSKFEMGFPIPPKHGEGVVGGYHCWAWFLPSKKGWIPVDISEANRHPELKEYYFGNLTEDRVRFTTGRDINLEPRQKGPALNFFIYPYAEVDGKTWPQENIQRRFAYKDMD